MYYIPINTKEGVVSDLNWSFDICDQKFFHISTNSNAHSQYKPLRKNLKIDRLHNDWMWNSDA